MIRARWVALVCLAGACGACSAAGDGPVYSDTAAPVLAVDAPLAAAEPEPCGVAFDPASELLEATQRAAERWSAATGCDVRVEAGGVPIVVLDEVIGDGKSVRATTRTMWVDGELQATRIEIRSDSLDQIDRILPHELGHAIGGFGHTSTGLMREAPKAGDPIDAASLTLVCSTLPCRGYQVER